MGVYDVFYDGRVMKDRFFMVGSEKNIYDVKFFGWGIISIMFRNDIL